MPSAPKAQDAPKLITDGESRMHRLRVGDIVSWDDTSEHPPIHHEGPIKGFANEELTYVSVDFDGDSDKVLTEDEVRRIA
jgi:hypothetical protein